MMLEEHLPGQATRDEPHNSAFLTADGVTWWVGNSFADTATVLPAFLAQLDAPKVLIGFLTGFRAGGFLLPQIVVAHFSERWPRKKGLVIFNSLLGRSCQLAIPFLIFFLAGDSPELALNWFVALYVVASLSEGVNAVPWTDIMAKAVHPLRRGRVYGRIQFWGGLASFGAGILVNRILTSPHLPYPSNFSLLFGLSALGFIGSYLAFLAIREPAGQEATIARRSLAGFCQSLPELWRASPDFACLARVRLLAGGVHLALPFFVLYARDELGLGAGLTGLFLACQMAGSVAGGLLWGRLGDDRGYRLVLILSLLAALAGPVLALLAGLGFPVWLSSLTFGAIFLLLGLSFGGAWIGFTNYLLEVVPAGRRPSYLGMLNTLAGPTTFLSIVGGYLVDVFGYRLVFILTAGLLALGLHQGLSLKEPRLSAATQPEEGGD
jgi:MFS family permease